MYNTIENINLLLCLYAYLIPGTAEMTSPELPSVVKPSRKRTHSCRNREDNNSSDEESDNEHQPDKRPRVSTTSTQVDQSYMETD
jgi:hypothetical protein